jgi:hypothetical protein
VPPAWASPLARESDLAVTGDSGEVQVADKFDCGWCVVLLAHVFTFSRSATHQNPRALARTGSAWTHPLAGRLSYTRSPSWLSPPSMLPATLPVFVPFRLSVHPLIAVFALRLLVSRRRKHPTAIARMCSAARCLSNCGPSFKGLVAARLCDAAHCLCNQGSFSIPILLLLLALLPLQAFALVTHASAPGVGTSALKNG